MIGAMVFFLLGSAADWYTTKRGAIDRPHRFAEAWPPMRFLLERLGPHAKAWVTAALFLALVLTKAPAWPYWFFGGVFFVLAAWNLYVIRRATRG